MTHRPDLDDLDREIADHIDAETLDNIAQGMSETDARAAALRKFGNITRVKEDVRDVWIAAWWDHCRQDARDAWRRVRRSPGLAIAVAGTLALGIGLTTAIFSVVNAVLMRPLAYVNPERTVWLSTVDPRDNTEGMLSGFDFADWRAQSTTLARAVAYSFWDATVVASPYTGRWRILSASDGFWAMTGAQPVLGTLPPADREDVLILTHHTFRDRFGSDPHVIGRVITVGGESATIGAVLPEGFAPQLPAWQWRPGVDQIAIDAYRGLRPPAPGQNRRAVQQAPIYLAIGELAAGVSLEQARAELATIHKGIDRGEWAATSVAVTPLRDKVTGEARFALQLLLAAALCVLLITCANVANLLLSRASARQREIALRMSVGGGRLRLVRQLLAESLAFAVLGGLLGIMVAWALVRTIVGALAPSIPRLAETTVDTRVLAFAAALSCVTALVFGLGPALALSRTNALDLLRGSSRTASPRVRVAARASMVLQLALTVVLFSTAGLLLKSVWQMTSYPPTLDPGQVLMVRVEFAGEAYREPAPRTAYVDALLERARQLPGVRQAAVTTDQGSWTVVIKEGQPVPEDRAAHSATVSSVSPGFGPLLGLSLVRGRWLSDNGQRGEVLINEALARQDFPGVDPIGQRLQLPWVDNRLGTIVGVVQDLKYARIDADAEPELFVHYKHTRLFGVTLALRLDGDADAALPTVVKALADIDPTQALFAVNTLEQRLSQSIAPQRFNLVLLATFAVVALVIVVLGIYGVVAYTVSARTQEIGIRVALGAYQRQVVGMIVRQAMSSVALGLAAGLVLSALAARLVATLLYDVAPTDAPTLAAVTALLAAIAVAASTVPALKAAVVDPTIALRAD